jgi:hypothetical protein
LRPPALYRSPLPRTKLESTVPDGQVTGLLEVGDRSVSVSGWRGTVGHNWGSEHADSWAWLHAEGFGGAPEAWLEPSTAAARRCQESSRSSYPKAEAARRKTL